MKKKYFFLVLVFLAFVFSLSNAAEKVNEKTVETKNPERKVAQNIYSCDPVELPSSFRNKSIKDLTIAFRELNRRDLEYGLWAELKNSESSQSLILPLLYFLSGTENRKDIRGFYKLIVYLLVGEKDREKILANWPVRVSTSPINISSDEICNLYNRAIELSQSRPQ